MSVGELVQDAEGVLEETKAELARGEREGNRLLLRDAAEKAWNAVVQAVNALAQVTVGRTPKSHYERRLLLKELEAREPELARFGLDDRYAARNQHLHGEVFYEGALDLALLRLELDKMTTLLHDVRRLVETRQK